MMVETPIRLGAEPANFQASPIRPEWVLEGKPEARIELLSSSSDGTASTYFWDCTAGRFNWFYSFDETLYILEGSVVLKFPDGTKRSLAAGDTIFFPTGSQAEWTVSSYIRKLAFCRAPLPSYLVSAKRVARWIKNGGRHPRNEGSGLL